MIIPICGYDYKVQDAKLDTHINGLCDPDSRTISLSSEISGGLRDEVLLHEVVHGIFFETGLCELLNGKLEEALCVALSKHLPKAGYCRAS